MLLSPTLSVIRTELATQHEAGKKSQKILSCLFPEHNLPKPIFILFFFRFVASDEMFLQNNISHRYKTYYSFALL